MKVLIFNSLYFPNLVGGAERSVQILAEGLLEKGITPVVVSTSDKDYEENINGVKVYYVKVPNLYWMKIAKEQPRWKKPIWHLVDIYNIFAERKIREILINERPDIVHTNNLAGFSVIVWKIAKELACPVVHTIRDYYLLCPRSTMFKNGKNCVSQCGICKVYSVSKKIISNRCVDAVVGISKFILEKHLAFGYFKNTNIKVLIYNPVTSSESPGLKIQKSAEIVLGLVGTMSPDKGTDFVLKCFGEGKLPNVKLFIYGRGITQQYEKALKTKYSLANVEFKGVRDPKEIYKEIDVLLVSSLWNEPFGRVVPEAYSYGIPVLASNRGGLPELVKEGKTGFIFDPDKEGDFEEKLEKIVSHIRFFSKREIIEASRQFRKELIIEKYINVYTRLLNNDVV